MRIETLTVLFLCGAFAGVPCSAQSKFQPRTAGAGIQQVGLMQHPGLRESSGLIATSRTNLFWTHNDGPVPLLFAIDRLGEVTAEFRVTGASLTDWEDIARDDTGNLYLADIGNNDADRRQLHVHRIAEPDLAHTTGMAPVTRSWVLNFPAQPFNSESLFIWRDHGFVISKLTKDRRAVIYRFPLAATNCTLEVVAELPVTSPVTAADLSRDGKMIGLVCKSGAYIFDVDGDLRRAAEVHPRFAAFREGQIEGCCFVPEGLLAVSEKREVFLYSWAAFGPK